MNDEVIIDVIRNQQKVYTASPLTRKNLIREIGGQEFEAVTLREKNMLEGAGYKQIGDYYIPPSKLDLK
jgi:hypothetical protein